MKFEGLVGDSKLCIGFSGQPSQELGEVFPLLKLSGLLFWKIGRECMTLVLDAEAKRVRTTGQGDVISKTVGGLLPSIEAVIRAGERQV